MSFFIMGVDEAGRGPLIGPVVTSSILVSTLEQDQLIFENLSKSFKDSKKLKPHQREKILNDLNINCQKLPLSFEDQVLYFEIHAPINFKIAISSISHKTIDEINILNATKLGMKNATFQILKHLSSDDLCHILIDGNMKFDWNDPKIDSITSVIKGDSTEKIISLASIIAKTTRDYIMDEMDALYPHFEIKSHKGYPTKKHKELLKIYGPTPYHRLTFNSK